LGLSVSQRLWNLFRSPDRRTSREAGAVLVSLTAFLGQSVVDNLVNLPMILLLLVSIVAWCDRGISEGQVSQRPAREGLAGRWPALVMRSPLIPLVAVVAIVAVIPKLIDIDRAAQLSRIGQGAALKGHWEAAYVAYDQARRTDPAFTLYELQTAGALARIGRVAEARMMLALAVQADPLAMNVIGLAALDAQEGDRAAALKHVSEARALGFGEATVALNAGLIADRLGDRDLALDAYADAIAWDPALALAEIWSSPPRLVPKAELLSEARSRVDVFDAALILAYGGNPQRARIELEALPASSRREAYIAAADALAGDVRRADARLHELLEANPFDWYAAAWFARIGALTERREITRKYSKWAMVLQADGAPAIIGDASVIPGPAANPVFSLPANYPWAVYLRPSFPYPLMPQVVPIGYQ
jgi:tetratricopeptide (TPR) repeat protein